MGGPGRDYYSVSLEWNVTKNSQVQGLAHRTLFLSHSPLSPEMTKSFTFQVLSDPLVMTAMGGALKKRVAVPHLAQSLFLLSIAVQQTTANTSPLTSGFKWQFFICLMSLQSGKSWEETVHI